MSVHPPIAHVAEAYAKRGWKPVPVSRKTKRPIGKEWQKRPYHLKQFNGNAQNVGIQFGAVSSGLCDVDLDCIEAIGLAPEFLPHTDAVFGRNSKPSSHMFYITDLFNTEKKAVRQFEDGHGQMVLELRTGGNNKGAHSDVPPSMHTTGEMVEWVRDGEPTKVDGEELKRAVLKLAVAVLLKRYYPAQGSRHEGALVIGGVLARAEWSKDEIEHLVRVVSQAADDEEVEDRVTAAGSAVDRKANGEDIPGLPRLREKWGDDVATPLAKWLDWREPCSTTSTPLPPPKSRKPQIIVKGGNLTKNVSEAEKILIASGYEFYQRGTLLVRPVLPKKRPDKDDEPGWKMQRLEPMHLVDVMTAKMEFLQFDPRFNAYKQVDAPVKLVRAYLARAGFWKAPYLASITTAPFLRRDGSISQQQGYDAATGMLFKPSNTQFPSIPDAPTKDEARAALEELKDPFKTFPFVTDADRSVLLSGILTPLDRCSMATAPMHSFSAPAPGTGKSLLPDAISIIVRGYKIAVMSQGRTEEELEKRLGAALLAGRTIVSIDNCKHPLEGGFLCQMLSQENCSVRPLGVSDDVDVPVNCTVYSNGNNLIIADDLTRRSIIGEMDAKCERPELRNFKVNLLKYVKEHRARLVVAALTILRAYHVASERVELTPLGSFEEWSHRIREPLVWLGEADPCITMDRVRNFDPVQNDLATVIAQWKQHLRTKAVTIKEVIDRAVTIPEFHTALLAVAANRSGIMVSHERLGRWLQRIRGKIVGKMCFRNVGSSCGYPIWQLVNA
jgi:hypothetical protein